MAGIDDDPDLSLTPLRATGRHFWFRTMFGVALAVAPNLLGGWPMLVAYAAVGAYIGWCVWTVCPGRCKFCGRRWDSVAVPGAEKYRPRRWFDPRPPNVKGLDYVCTVHFPLYWSERIRSLTVE